MPGWLSELLPIVALLALIVVVVARLPRADLGHSPAYLRRRFANWFPVGLTYAFLYMGRYNLRAVTNIAFDKASFAEISAWGALVYGVAFVVNGPLTDRIGGKKTIVLAAAGASIANIAMGVLVQRALVGATVPKEAQASLVPTLSILYALNMYFQSFGAVAIVKVNSAWFHLRERGTFGGIFGILISLGLYFAFDWCRFIVEATSAQWVFFVPASILAVFAVLNTLLVKDTPGEAGHADFDLGDVSSDEGPRLGVIAVFKKMLRSPAIIVIALVEFCSGFLRNAIMSYYQTFAEETHRAASPTMKKIALAAGPDAVANLPTEFVHDHWGMVVGALLMFPALHSGAIGWVVVGMTLAIIGVHGMLSGTATMDFGGKRNVGVVVGIIDGCVYLGTSLEHAVLGKILPKGAAQADSANWWKWPAVMLPVAVIGLVLATRVWNARPAGKAAAAH